MVLTAQHKSNDCKFVKRTPACLGSDSMASPEQAIYFRRYQTSAYMEESERFKLRVVAVTGLRAVSVVELVARLQTANTHAFVQIKGSAPTLLQSSLKRISEPLVLSEHAGSIRPEALGKDVRCGLCCVIECRRDFVLIYSALRCLGNQLLEQVSYRTMRIATVFIRCHVMRVPADKSTEASNNRTQETLLILSRSHGTAESLL